MAAAEITVAPTDEATIEEITTEAAAAAVPTALSDKYADLDNRSFVLDGRLYTLGVSTLQDFIDNGAEFQKTENYDKMWNDKFTGQIDYNTFECVSALNKAKFSFANLNNDPVTMKECVLVGVSYLNNLEKERKGTETKIQFAFPNTLTKDELIANSGEPTAKEDDDEVSYTVVSQIFPKYDSGYTFHFGRDELINSIEIEWLP